MDNNSMGLPIFIIHKGDNLSLPFVLRQAKFFNPNSRIILIGDETNEKYNKYAEHFFISDYSVSGKLLKEYYKHFSPNPYDFELICLQRWFILLDFLEKNKIEQCFYMDSDVMLYSDLNEEVKFYANCGLTINDSRLGHCMFINNTELLKELCEYILNTYKNNSLIELKAFFSLYLKRKVGGISDMAFLNSFFEINKNRMLDTYNIVNKSIFDNVFMDSKDFEKNKGLKLTGKHKKILWNKGLPYGILLKNNEKIRLKSIHFQGSAKKIIPLFFSNKVNIDYLIMLVVAIFKGINKLYLKK